LANEALNKEKEILMLLEFLFKQEELSWLHRGRDNWLRHDDHNKKFTKNLHFVRKKMNMIKYLLDEQGSKVECNNKLAALIHNYFT
jgi:hypothetical protein